MSLNKQASESAVKEMKALWGGDLPSWEAYKKALKNGQVRANKTLAAQAINMKGIPKAYFIVYGIITLWLGFLLFPITAFVWFFMDFSAWWILVSLLVGWFLVKVSREGHCQGMMVGAENNKELYEILVNNGAFLFSPEGLENRKS